MTETTAPTTAITDVFSEMSLDSADSEKVLKAVARLYGPIKKEVEMSAKVLFRAASEYLKRNILLNMKQRDMNRSIDVALPKAVTGSHDITSTVEEINLEVLNQRILKAINERPKKIALREKEIQAVAKSLTVKIWNELRDSMERKFSDLPKDEHILQIPKQKEDGTPEIQTLTYHVYGVSVLDPAAEEKRVATVKAATKAERTVVRGFTISDPAASSETSTPAALRRGL